MLLLFPVYSRVDSFESRSLIFPASSLAARYGTVRISFSMFMKPGYIMEVGRIVYSVDRF